MARYIDVEKLYKILNEEDMLETYEDYMAVNRAINDTPTADVVPKSEVERLTVELDAMRGAANTYKMHYENAMKEIERLKDYNTGVAFKHYFDGRKEVAREIFEEINEDCFDQFGYFEYEAYAELKKKYTEGKE